MKKRLLAILLTLCMVAALLPTAVFATETTVSDAATLKTAIEGATAGDKITLGGNITVTSTIGVTKDVTLDLNGYTITGDNCRVFQVKSGTLTLTGSGTVETKVVNSTADQISNSSSVIRVGTDDNAQKVAAGLVVDENVTVLGNITQAVSVWGKTTTETVDIKGTLYSKVDCALTGYGVNGYGGTDITIESTATLKTDSVKDSAIYHPQAGTLTIKGGTIIGASAIEVKAGDTTVEVDGNPTITATQAYNHTKNGNGNSTKGCAVAVVENDSYTGAATVTIKSGTYTGEVGIYKDDEVAASKKATLTIEGGTFSSDPSNYVASGLVAEYINGVYTVREKAADEVLEKPATAEPAVDVSGITGDEATKAAVSKAAASVEVSDVVNVETAEKAAETYSEADQAAAVAALEAAKDLTIPAGADITVYTQVYLDVKATDYDADEGTIAMDITPKSRLVASYAATADDIKIGTNAVSYKEQVIEVDEPVEMSVELPSTVKAEDDGTLYIEHITESEDEIIYTGTVDESNVVTFTNPDGFSSFKFGVDAPVATNGRRGYKTLAAAFAKVKNNGTIELAGDNSETLYVDNPITFTLKGNYTGKVVANNSYIQITSVKNASAGTVTYQCVGINAPVYSVTVNDVEGGTIKSSASYATKGAVVVLTPVPADEDGELVSLTVTDASGNELTLTKRSNGTYTFVMPAEKVTVTGTFTTADTEEPEEPSEDEEPSEETTENPFTDVEEGNDYYEAILWAVENGITKGTSATTFSPAMDCTRAQVVTFLYRAAGSPEPTTTENPFTDVEEGTDYYKAILWAVENGITKGTSATTFSPNVTCTRAQVVTFLYRAAGQPELTTTENPFTDVEAGNDYYKAILWAVENGITKGTSATTFSPAATCTRAQIVTFLYRNAAETEAEAED